MHMCTFKTRQQLADQLGISRRTLHRLIKQLELDIPQRKLLSPADQQKILLALGVTWESTQR